MEHVDRLWLLLVKIMMCTAAAACHDAPTLGHDVKGLREQLFAQAISSSYLVYNQNGLRNTQVLILVVSAHCHPFCSRDAANSLDLGLVFYTDKKAEYGLALDPMVHQDADTMAKQ